MKSLFYPKRVHQKIKKIRKSLISNPKKILATAHRKLYMCKIFSWLLIQASLFKFP